MRLRRARRERDAGPEDKLCRQGKRKDAASAYRRGSDEEGGLPAGQNSFANGKDRRRDSYSDQDDRDGSCRDRCGRMHDNAQRAMVSCGLDRMNVCDLNQGQKRKKQETQKRGRA
jgi:hypothetical protein